MHERVNYGKESGVFQLRLNCKPALSKCVQCYIDGCDPRITFTSYIPLILYMGIVKVWDFLPENITPKPA